MEKKSPAALAVSYSLIAFLGAHASHANDLPSPPWPREGHIEIANDHSITASAAPVILTLTKATARGFRQP